MESHIWITCTKLLFYYDSRSRTFDFTLNTDQDISILFNLGIINQDSIYYFTDYELNILLQLLRD